MTQLVHCYSHFGMTTDIQGLNASQEEILARIAKLSEQLAQTQNIVQTLNTPPPPPSDTNTSPIDWGKVLSGAGDVFAGVAKAAAAALPLAERYGMLKPAYGHPFRLPYPGEPGYAYAASGGYSPYYGRYAAGVGTFGLPQGVGTWLLVGGAALVLLAMMSRRRRQG